MKILSALERNFFQKTYLPQLALLRILLIAYLVYDLPQHFLLLHGAVSMPEEFMQKGLFLRYSPLPFPISELHVDTYHTLMLELGILSLLGFLTRISLFLFTLGYTHLLAIESAWGWHDHGPSLTVQVLLVLVFAPGVTSYSLDSAWSAFKTRRSEPFFARFRGPSVMPWGYTLILLLVCTFYFTSGLSKLRYGGTEWLNGKTLSFYLSGISRSNQLQTYGSAKDVEAKNRWKDGYGLEFYTYGASPSALAKEISQSPTVSAFGAISAVFLELLFPLALLGRRIRFFFLLSAGVFHFSIFELMGISFFPWCIIDFCLIDWSLRKKS